MKRASRIASKSASGKSQWLIIKVELYALPEEVTDFTGILPLFHASTIHCDSCFILPVMFSMSTFETMAPKSMDDPADAEMGVMVI